MSLQGQVVLITGGTRGIGRAIALRLARERPKHILTTYCMNHEAARRTVADIQALGVAASSLAVDVGNEQMLKELFDSVRERCGRLDVFISNAARTAFSAGTELKVRSWQRIQEINSQAFLTGAQLASAIMRDNGGGRIIGISSLGSRFYRAELRRPRCGQSRHRGTGALPRGGTGAREHQRKCGLRRHDRFRDDANVAGFQDGRRSCRGANSGAPPWTTGGCRGRGRSAVPCGFRLDSRPNDHRRRRLLTHRIAGGATIRKRLKPRGSNHSRISSPCAPSK